MGVSVANVEVGKQISKKPNIIKKSENEPFDRFFYLKNDYLQLKVFYKSVLRIKAADTKK